MQQIIQLFNINKLMVPDQQQYTNQFDTLYNQIKQEYQEHRIDGAFEKVQKFQTLCAKENIKIPQPQSEFISLIKQEMNDVNFFQSKIVQQGWQVQTKNQNLTVSTKIQDKSVGVLVQGVLDIHIERFLSAVIQVDLMKKFMPFMVESTVKKIVARNNRLCHSVNKFPFLNARQAHFQGIGYDRMAFNRSVLVYSRSIHDKPTLQKRYDHKIVLDPKAVQLDYKYFVIQYFPLAAKYGKMKLAINVDMHINVPFFLLKPVTQNFGKDFYQNVLSIAKKFQGSDWQKKSKQNPQFYDFVRRRINEQFPTQEAFKK